MPARNTLVQLLALYRARMHSVTDRRTDGWQDYANSRSYCVAVRSAKKRAETVGTSAIGEMYIDRRWAEVHTVYWDNAVRSALSAIASWASCCCFPCVGHWMSPLTCV